MGALTVVAAAGAGGGVAIWRSTSGDGDGATVTGGSSRPPSLDELANNIVAGGPGRNGIPPIDRPDFVAASEAGFLEDEDRVFGLLRGGEVRAYPQPVLVWHEVVNDDVAGEPLTVTYCPLTGSVVGFKGSARGRPLEFGTTGNLVNSNLLMFDGVTDSEWPQLLGTAIRGPRKGARLTEIPLVWTSWKRWRELHPDTLVLSTNTGHARDYGQDPYGSYAPTGGYYESGDPIFPVTARSDRFAPKQVVVGVKAGDERLAVLKSTVGSARVLPLHAGRTPLLAVWDDELATARVFVRQARGRTLEFRRGELRDSTGSTWDATGQAVKGRLSGARLPVADFLDVMWFAWHAFFPQTKVVA